MATPNQPYGTAPHVGTHPEITRFEREFDRRLIPPDVQLSFEPNAISGERPNTGLSRLGFTFGLLFAMLIGGGIVVWLPPLNFLWAAAMLAMIVLLPIFGARAALFRLRVGRAKNFRVEFSEDQARWQSNDDDFWQPVKEFFRL